MKRGMIIIVFVATLGFSAQGQKTKTENIILITLDGMRWQEILMEPILHYSNSNHI